MPAFNPGYQCSEAAYSDIGDSDELVRANETTSEDIPSETKLSVTAENFEYVSLLYSSLRSPPPGLFIKVRVEAYIDKDDKRVFCVEGIMDVQKPK
ncbi:hypothetical protein BGZ72_007219 [Mortierella alpina]|nr:hypothetical protein BGZ72_007219 [Mortierella alpina]